MQELAALGNSEFILGFQLAGIRNTIEVDKNLEKNVENLLTNKQTGIIVTNQETIDKLPIKLKEKLMNSVDPVAVLISTEAEDQNMRDMIKKSIGVDLWSKD